MFSVADLVAATGWKESSARTVISKKLRPFVSTVPGGLQVKGLSGYSRDDFIRLMSQRQEIAAEPKRPHLTLGIEALLRKAQESALLALEIYNNRQPSSKQKALSS
jgi:hypothetical protein